MGHSSASIEASKKAWSMASLVFLATMAAYIARVNISVALPYMSEDFGWDRVQEGLYGGLLLGIFLVGYGLSNIFLSPLVDRFGARRSLLVAIATFSLLTFFMGLVGLMFSFLLLARVLLGVAQGIVYPSASKATQAWFPQGKRSKVNSLHLSAMLWSNLLVPIILIPVIVMTDWRYAFLVVAGMCALTLIPINLYLKDSPNHSQNESTSCAAHTPLRLKVINDLREASRIRGLFSLSGADAAGNMVWWGISLWLPSYLKAQGMAPSEIMWVASLPYFGGIAGLLIGSYLSDRTGKVLVITVLFQAAGAITLLLMVGVNSPIATMAVLACLFFCIALLPPNAFTLLQNVAPPEIIGSATGIMNGIAVGMGAIGPILLGTVVAASGSFEAGFVIMAGLQVLSSLLLLRFGELSKQRSLEVKMVAELGTK
ncbi:MAG: MFS transporter [Methanomassiliicoccales archaeon]